VNITFKQGTLRKARNSPVRWQARLIAIAAAAVVNVTISLIARAGTGRFPRAEINGDVQTIAVAQIVVTTIVVGLVAWAVYAGLVRISSHPVRTLTILALMSLALSMLGPLGSGVDDFSKAVLAGMHLATAALLIPVIPVTARR
jgi:hypothetical protein